MNAHSINRIRTDRSNNSYALIENAIPNDGNQLHGDYIDLQRHGYDAAMNVNQE